MSLGQGEGSYFSKVFGRIYVISLV